MPEGMIDRRIASVVQARMAEVPVVALQGPRAVGKSTVLRQLASRYDALIVDLDNVGVRAAVADEPGEFVAGPGPVFVDEYQRVPDVLDAIKSELNRDFRPGRFLITGSTRFDALPQAAQSLTGRIHFETILPFSQGEMSGVNEDFLEVALTDPGRLTTGLGSGLGRAGYAERVCNGGMPVAIRLSGMARTRWFDDYTNASLRRDATGVSRIQRDAQLPGLLARLAGQTAQVLNITAAGASVGLDRTTANSYVTLLEDLFLIHRLPAWGRTLRARSTALPKVHLVDSGLAARLLRLSPAKLAQLDPASLTEFGHLLETFAIGELLKQASWSEHVSGLGHWRTHDGHEVDLVIERDDGRVVGFEIKASGQVHSRDAKGLVALSEVLGSQFVAGLVLTTGNLAYRHDDRIYVVPIDRMWEPSPPPRKKRR